MPKRTRTSVKNDALLKVIDEAIKKGAYLHAHHLPKWTGGKLYLALLTDNTRMWAAEWGRHRLELLPNVFVDVPDWFFSDDPDTEKKVFKYKRGLKIERQ